MKIAGFGRFIFWEGGSLYIGSPVAPSELHRHHAIQLSLGLRGEVQFRQSNAADWTVYSGVVIPPDLPHTFQAPGKVIAHIFGQPESIVGRRILTRIGRDRIAALDISEARALGAALKDAYFNNAPNDDLAAIARQAFRSLTHDEIPQPDLDVRLRRALAEIDRRLDEPLTLPGLALQVGLSEGRFRHLFVSQVGVSFRVYVLWARLNRALALGYSGTPWTEAAYAAGFADSAHLTRTCRRTFGVAPSSLADDGRRLGEAMTA